MRRILLKAKQKKNLLGLYKRYSKSRRNMLSKRKKNDEKRGERRKRRGPVRAEKEDAKKSRVLTEGRVSTSPSRS